MGFLVLTSLTTGKTQVLGDEVDKELARKAEGLPTVGRPQSKLDQIDKEGE